MKQRGWLLAVFLIALVGSILATYLVITSRGGAPGTTDEIPRITKEELLPELERNDSLLLVDTRNKSSYDRDHIRGAVSVPASTIASGDWVPPSGKEIIFYCD